MQQVQSGRRVIEVELNIDRPGTTPGQIQKCKMSDSWAHTCTMRAIVHAKPAANEMPELRSG
jgi:hypothetical protein